MKVDIDLTLEYLGYVWLVVQHFRSEGLIPETKFDADQLMGDLAHLDDFLSNMKTRYGSVYTSPIHKEDPPHD